MADNNKTQPDTAIRELRESLLESNEFKKALLWDLLRWSIKALGWGGAILTVIVIFFGQRSLSSLARSTMMDYLESEGEVYKQQFERLSQIPSYTTTAAEITVNDPESNFVPLPIFSDINRRAKYDECDWFMTPNVIKGIEGNFEVARDSIDDVHGYRFTSTNRKLTGGSYRHGPGPPTTEYSPPFSARVFIFASRKVL